MTTSASFAQITGLDRTVPPGLQGISHLGLTVADVSGAIEFWCAVMDFRVVIQDEQYCMVWQPSAKLAIGLTAQGGAAVGPFDPHRVGLDHLALAVADLQTLQAWADRLTALSVPHSPVTETDAGHHLNARGPDDIAIELFAIKADFARGILGIDLEGGGHPTVNP